MPLKRNNDQIILEQIIRERHAESEEEFTFSEYFEVYTASEILKDYDLSFDDISYGIVGNGGDGGIDSIYTFINGEHLKEDTEVNSSQRKSHIELVLIQSKSSNSFSEDAIIKLRESAQDLFDLGHPLEDFHNRYNENLIDKVNLFRSTYSRLARTFPKVTIRYFYATQGMEPHPNVKGKVEKLRADISGMFSGAEFSFGFIGASELLEITRNVPSTSRDLEVAESPISTLEGSYLCLVSLSNYYKFISDTGSLARSIFESNVRDYQGSVKVNTAIRKTLENKQSENFWYLNNGVTVITPNAVLAGKKLTIEDPQIVNGLQTSHEIYQHFSRLDNEDIDDRTVLVRIICEENEEARDRIIRATNSQTSIPPASLRSSDDIHRNIEDFLKSNGYYYDRKKNFYKNLGKPASRVISIPYMAQAMMAVMLLKPDSARARPSTLINSDAEYERIFSLDKPIDIYLKAVQVMKSVESYLKPEKCGQPLEKKTITNIKFYVAMMTGIKLVNSLRDIEKKIAELPNVNISEEMLASSLEIVLSTFQELGASDQVAKGSRMVVNLLESENLININ